MEPRQAALDFLGQGWVVGAAPVEGGCLLQQAEFFVDVARAEGVGQVEAEGSLAAYFWGWEPDGDEVDRSEEFVVPATTPTSTAIAKDLKQRGWTFVGPTTLYAFMQEEGSSATRNGGWVPPSTTPESVAMAKDLKKRGWSFVGPTTVYAFMQAMGMVNDHLPGCTAHAEVEALRAHLVRPS